MQRRDVLRNVTGAAAGSVALSGLATGETVTESESDLAHLQREYESADDIVGAFESHADDMLAELESEGFVESADVTDLNALDGEDGLSAESEDVRVMSTVDGETGTPTAVVRVTERFSDGETNVFVLPEAGRQYATIEYDDGREELWRSNADNCEFSHENEVCTGDDCLTKNQNCWKVLPCVVTYYVQDTYKVYECADCGTSGCQTWTKEEFHSSVCTNDCCQDSGNGCGCSSFGCSAE